MTEWAAWWDALSREQRTAVLRCLSPATQEAKQYAPSDGRRVPGDWTVSMAKWEWCHVDDDVRREIRKLAPIEWRKQ
jgi:TRAP-type C4-dicarboxylate transport system substrate-binding protein